MLRKHAPSVDQDVCLGEMALVKDIAATEESKAHGLGTASKEGVQKTISIMREYMNLKTDVASDEVYTMQFLPKR